MIGVRSRSEKHPPRVMIGFTGRARDGSEYDPALRLPRTGSNSSSGVLFLFWEIWYYVIWY